MGDIVAFCNKTITDTNGKIQDKSLREKMGPAQCQEVSKTLQKNKEDTTKTLKFRKEKKSRNIKYKKTRRPQQATLGFQPDNNFNKEDNTRDQLP